MDFALPDAADPVAPQAIRLCTLHLNHRGLSELWLLRLTAERHWRGIARAAGRPLSALRDRGGARVFAAVTSIVLDGAVDRFAEDEIAHVETVELPTAASAWRSVHRVSGGNDAAVGVEIVSTFVRRVGASNARLEVADMPEALRPPAPDALPRQVRVLRSRSVGMRRAALGGPPVVSAPILTDEDFDGAGLLDFGVVLRIVSLANAVAMEGPWGPPPLARREIHYYNNADCFETIEVASDPRVVSIAPEPEMALHAAARRGSDGALIAVCETRLGGAG